MILLPRRTSVASHSSASHSLEPNPVLLSPKEPVRLVLFRPATLCVPTGDAGRQCVQSIALEARERPSARVPMGPLFGQAWPRCSSIHAD